MNPDDPKLTAYALDELDPDERAEIEQLLRDDPAARGEAEQTAAFAARLRHDLKTDPGAPLTDGQRTEVLAAATRTGARPKVVAFPRPRWILPAIAACLVVGVSIALLFPAYHAENAAERKSPPSVDQNGLLKAKAAKSEAKDFDQPTIPPRIAMREADAWRAPDRQFMAAPVPAVPMETEPAAAAASRDGSGTRARVAGATEGPPLQRMIANADAGGMVALKSDTSGGRSVDELSKLGAFREATAPGLALRQSDPANTESYDAITDNAFLAVRENPLSTFSIDVDTASYANVRRFLNQQTRPPKGAVRIEELLNYFSYDYPQPDGDAPFSATMEVAACPWAPEHRLVRVGLKGREIREEKRPASNLVFLIDVCGSMMPENRLPLVKRCLAMLVDRLSPEDTVAIAVYAGASGCVLEPTHDQREIRAALDRLQSGGSTNGAAGIHLAYRLAEQSFIRGGVNRVILATDGDFNVGVTSQSDLVELIARKAKSGVFLTVLGFGMGNLKDSTLEKLADKGNGNYAYIDTLNEGRKVLVEQLNGTLVTIAKDVKIQVEFNPAQAAAYRLIGYENRLLAKADFNDDRKDAGEIGAGHTVTALYEVVPAGRSVTAAASVDPLKYQASAAKESAARNPEPGSSSELLTLKLRYKRPDGDTSRLLEFPLTDRGETWEKSSRDFRFAAAVAGFGMLLRESPHKGSATWDSVREMAMEGRGDDRLGYRGEFLTLIDKAKALAR